MTDAAARAREEALAIYTYGVDHANRIDLITDALLAAEARGRAEQTQRVAELERVLGEARQYIVASGADYQHGICNLIDAALASKESPRG
jgi:hypothetical protein